MTDYIWKKLKDVELPKCALCHAFIVESYYTEVDYKIICEECAGKISEAYSQL